MESESNESESLIALPCRYFRSKEMYYQGVGGEEDEFASGVYWCIKTHEGFGPDGQDVGKTACCAGRKCYVN